MVRRLVLAGLVAMSVASCARISESRMNPFNWFGGDQSSPETLPVAEVAVAHDPRVVVDAVVAVRIERTPGGAILMATGLPPSQGYYDAALVPDAERSAPGRLVYQFRAQPPVQPGPVSTPRSRELRAALFLTDQDLAGVREVQVLGAQASRSVRR